MNIEGLSERLYQRREEIRAKNHKNIEERYRRGQSMREEKELIRKKLVKAIVDDFKEYFDIDKGTGYIYAWGNTDTYYGYMTRHINNLSEYWKSLKGYCGYKRDRQEIINMVRAKLPTAINHVTGDCLWKVNFCYKDFSGESKITGISISVDLSGYPK